MPKRTTRRFEDRLTAKSSWSNVFKREHVVHRKRFLGYANLQCMYARRKFILRGSFIKRSMLFSLNIRCVRTSSGRQKQHLNVNAGLHTCITF